MDPANLKVLIMLNMLRRFRKNEDGAVTVDWVVLTAGVAFLGVFLVSMIQSAVTDKSEGIGAYISAREDQLPTNGSG